MRKDHAVFWTLVCFFGWLLSVPFSGPILNRIVSEKLLPGNLPLIFIGFHGLGLIVTSIVAKEKQSWRLLLLWGAGVCILGHLFLLFSNFAWGAEIAFAILGVSSASFVLGWTHPYSFLISSEHKIKTMAGIIIAANAMLFALNFLLQYLHPNIVLFLSLIPLLAALWFGRQIPAPRYKPATNPQTFPAIYLVLITLFVLIIYVNGGLLYNLIYPSFAALPYSHFFRWLAYIGVLLVIWALGSKVQKTLLVYLGASIMGVAFVLFGLFSDSVIASGAIVLLLESAFAYIDLFTWTIPAAIALIFSNSFRVFGPVLTANVAAIFIGYLIGEQLAKTQQYQLTTGLFASAIIFLAFLLIPWLKEFAEKEHASQTTISGKDIFDLPHIDSLTPRELEILELLLEGHSNKVTAGLLYISENTLKTHLKSIYGKLGISHRRELFTLIKQ